jgi:hypothetical protein
MATISAERRGGGGERAGWYHGRNVLFSALMQNGWGGGVIMNGSTLERDCRIRFSGLFFGLYGCTSI